MRVHGTNHFTTKTAVAYWTSVSINVPQYSSEMNRFEPGTAFKIVHNTNHYTSLVQGRLLLIGQVMVRCFVEEELLKVQ